MPSFNAFYFPVASNCSASVYAADKRIPPDDRNTRLDDCTLTYFYVRVVQLVHFCAAGSQDEEMNRLLRTYSVGLAQPGAAAQEEIPKVRVDSGACVQRCLEGRKVRASKLTRK